MMRQNIIDQVDREVDSIVPVTKIKQSAKKQSRFMTKLNESLTEKHITKERIATRFPVFKDVKKLWTYDYAGEEKKRFKGDLQWDPSSLNSL